MAPTDNVEQTAVNRGRSQALRVSPELDLRGLDIATHGCPEGRAGSRLSRENNHPANTTESCLTDNFSDQCDTKITNAVITAFLCGVNFDVLSLR